MSRSSAGPQPTAPPCQGRGRARGFGQKDITFIRLAGGQITTGPETGLGPDSSIGSGIVAGARYYFALWQNKSFESDLLAYNMASADADLAVKSMNQRIH